MSTTQLTGQQQTEASGTPSQDKLQESTSGPLRQYLLLTGIEGAGACTISLPTSGWKREGPRLPCSSLISSRQHNPMCELCRLPVCPTQTRTDIIRIIQEELQQAP